MKHADWLRTFPCIICGNPHTEIAHQRYSKWPKINPGLGRKDHRYMLQLCSDHHREQHKGSERAFWEKYGIDPIGYSNALWRCSGDLEATLEVLGTIKPKK